MNKQLNELEDFDLNFDEDFNIDFNIFDDEDLDIKFSDNDRKHTVEDIEKMIFFNIENVNQKEYFVSKKVYQDSVDSFSVILFCNKKTKTPCKKTWVTSNTNSDVGIMMDIREISDWNIEVVQMVDSETRLSEKILVVLSKKVKRPAQKAVVAKKFI